MTLHLLRQTSCLRIYYDLSNDWLLLDWQGELTLPAAQQAGLAVLDCCLHRPYSHVLNSHEHVTGVSWRAAAWLATTFLPHMRLAGIEYLAWLPSPALPGLSLLHRLLTWLPSSPRTAFGDLKQAGQWLRHTRAGQPRSYVLPIRLPAVQAQVAQQALAMHERVATKQRRRQRMRRAAA